MFTLGWLHFGPQRACGAWCRYASGIHCWNNTQESLFFKKLTCAVLWGLKPPPKTLFTLGLPLPSPQTLLYRGVYYSSCRWALAPATLWTRNEQETLLIDIEQSTCIMHILILLIQLNSANILAHRHGWSPGGKHIHNHIIINNHPIDIHKCYKKATVLPSSPVDSGLCAGKFLSFLDANMAPNPGNHYINITFHSRSSWHHG